MTKDLKVKDELPSAGKMKESWINTDVIDSKRLLDDIRCLVENSRRRVAQSVNSELVMLYWQIGKRINEDLPAENRAEYGAKVVELVSERLTAEYGKGFRRSNMFHMRRFSTMPRQELEALQEEAPMTPDLVFRDRVAEYLVELPPKGLLEAKLHEAIRLARGRVEARDES